MKALIKKSVSWTSSILIMLEFNRSIIKVNIMSFIETSTLTTRKYSTSFSTFFETHRFQSIFDIAVELGIKE